MSHVVWHRILLNKLCLKYAGVKAPAEGNSSTSINFELYSWVTTHLDLYDPIHHLALMVVLIVAHIPLFVSYRQVKHTFKFQNPSNTKWLMEEICTEPWISPENSDLSGKREGDPYIVLFIGYFLFDPGSLLPALFEQPHGKALRSPFTMKHSKKGLNIFNLIWLGLARAIKVKSVKGGKLNEDRKFETEETLIGLHDCLLACYVDVPYGMYEAVVELVGTECANTLKRHVGLLTAPAAHRPTSQGSDLCHPLLSERTHQSIAPEHCNHSRSCMTTLAEQYNLQPPPPCVVSARCPSQDGQQTRATVVPGYSSQQSAMVQPQAQKQSDLRFLSTLKRILYMPERGGLASNISVPSSRKRFTT